MLFQKMKGQSKDWRCNVQIENVGTFFGFNGVEFQTSRRPVGTRQQERQRSDGEDELVTRIVDSLLFCKA